MPVLVSNEVGAFHEWALAHGIPALHVPMPVPAVFTPRTLVRALWPLWGIVRRHHIQVIHANEQDLYPVAQYLGRLCRLPVVVSVHFTMERGFCEWAFRGSRNPDRIFFTSEGSREACRPGVSGIIPESKWEVLQNGLDLTHFVPDPAARESFRRAHHLGDELVIGVACALRPRKDLEHLIEAAARLHDVPVRVLSAGGPVSGDETYARRLLDEARARLGERVVVLGHLDELRGFYNALDIFVNTSHEEAGSISVIQALACGCPIVGYASRSVDGQILPDGGAIVRQDDVDQLTDTLRQWLADPAELLRRRSGARATAEQRFDIRKLSRQLWTAYQSLRKLPTAG
jgi:glycosyltransferase involved in cell wall biosynthesis